MNYQIPPMIVGGIGSTDVRVSSDAISQTLPPMNIKY